MSPRLEYSDLPLIRWWHFLSIVQVRAVTRTGEGVWSNVSLGLLRNYDSSMFTNIQALMCATYEVPES